MFAHNSPGHRRGYTPTPYVWEDYSLDDDADPYGLIDDPADIIDEIRRTGRFDGNAKSYYRSTQTREDWPTPGCYGRLLPEDAKRLAKLRADYQATAVRIAEKWREQNERRHQAWLKRQTKEAELRREQYERRRALANDDWRGYLGLPPKPEPQHICANCFNLDKGPTPSDAQTWRCRAFNTTCLAIRSNPEYTMYCPKFAP